MPLYPQQDWFDDWLRETGEQPPDFDRLPPEADLPALLRLADGRPVQSREEWRERRQELRALLEHWFWGRLPAKPPVLVGSELVQERPGLGCRERQVRLTFACPSPISFTIWLLVPEGPGPFPVFLTQTSHWVWAAVAAGRGYLCCVYPAADNDDQSARFAPAYPECDWATIPRRAWLAGRALDYLLTLDCVQPDQVAITGHSRNGKQALIAAAIDERIRAVVASSAGSGGAAPFRFASEREYEESVEWITFRFPDWFHPRLRFFTGHEQHLPVDCHAYLALIAPRACLLSTALGDGCEPTFAVERSYLAGREVYRFLGAPECLRIRWRPGGHETRGEDIEAYCDWCDLAFGRGQAQFPERLLHHLDWEDWRTQAEPVPKPPPPADDAESVRRALTWALGEEPPGYPRWGAFVAGSPQPAGERVVRLPVAISEYVPADLYYPAHATAPLPLVVWLHPYSWPSGYRGAYTIEHRTMQEYRIYRYLAEPGFACLAFDQLGFGGRLEEGAAFYQRYPRWSKLGKLVRDVRAAVDLACEHLAGLPHGDFELPTVDSGRVYLLGYALGGLTALHAAALDQRVAGVACFSGLTPLRADTDSAATGGLRRWWEWYGLLPRLGFFAGREQELPYDLDDLLRLIAPRPCLIYAPRHDRDADPAAVAECVARARGAWEVAGKTDWLTVLAPDDFNRFQPPQFQVAREWLQTVIQFGGRAGN